jgi:hypothetical protein
MKGRRIIFLFFLLATACLDPYNPSASSTNYNYLVVDSFVNSAEGTGTVLLTRTKPLDNNDPSPIVVNAQVSLEAEDGSSFAFAETNPGKYELSGASIDGSKKYRLKITHGNDSFESEFAGVVNTPSIDSITWKELDNKVEIYVNTHDDQNDSHYYRWRYDETWHYSSAFYSSFIYNAATHSVELRPFDDNIYDCYRNISSTDIVIFSTSKLQNDVVKNFTLTSFPVSNVRLQHLYSINVQQQVLSKEGFEYYQLLKKTTENLGTLFDPLPAQVTGNIRCITDPSQLVIGFFSVGTVDTKRIFISPQEIDFNGNSIVDPIYAGCEQDTLFLQDLGNFAGGDLLTSPAYKGPTLLGYLRSPTSCVDCRMAGGTTVKPDFWP